jgi:hypothetical protein
MDGWIKLHRKLLDNCIAKKPAYLSLWVILLLMAQHKESTFIWNNKKQVLKKGQLITGRKSLSKRTGIAESQIYKILNFFEMEQQIEQQKTNKFTLITIVNWNAYQQEEQVTEQQGNNKVTTKRQQSNTYKNVKNVKNDKNIITKVITSKSYGNSKINEVINYFELKLGYKLDRTIKSNRYACNNLIRKIEKEYPDKNAVEGIKLLIDIALSDSFHGKNMTNMGYLYRNYQAIANIYRAQSRSNMVSI